MNQKKTVTIGEDYDNTQLPIANFLEGALSDYYDIHKKLPDGVIIYRQGISGGQKKYLKKVLMEKIIIKIINFLR